MEMEREDEVFVAMYIGQQRKHFSRDPFVTVC